MELVRRGVKAIGLVDQSPSATQLAGSINQFTNNRVQAVACIGDVADEAFRRQVFDEISAKWGTVRIFVPAAGITRDSLAAKIDKTTGKAALYPVEDFRRVVEINLIAPIYWALEMLGRIAEDRFSRGLKRWQSAEHIQGTVVFIGSVSSRGNKGQIAYAATKAGLEGAARTLMMEAMFHGVRCGVIHPGFTDTPMVHKTGRGLDSRTGPAPYAIGPADSSRGDCRRDLLHDRQLGRQRRTVGRRRMASGGLNLQCGGLPPLS